MPHKLDEPDIPPGIFDLDKGRGIKEERVDIVRRAYIQARREVASADTTETLHIAMVKNMVRWIKLRVWEQWWWWKGSCIAGSVAG